MRISSKDLPQADRLESVIETVIAIGKGKRTDIEIANSISGIERDDRQGRYYRRAAEILGFVTNESNNAKLTSRGLEFLKDPKLTNPVLQDSVMHLNLYQKLFPYIELNKTGATRNEIIDYLQSIAAEDIGPTMIPRRISTILAWPKTLGIIYLEDDRYHLARNVFALNPVFNINDVDQPLFLHSGTLSEYQMVEEKVRKARDSILIYKDQAKLDRSNSAHTHLINVVASIISNK
ncbi:hypothetical protein HZA38_05185 [Candidatus Peregrinibacteria bacterium]|nr:hypothetical protein [Candidatus Peregrinibacteria bacterium]